MALVGYIVTNKVALWAAKYSACVVYTKTIIHLCVGESGGYLPRSHELKLGLENNHIQAVQVNVLFSASIGRSEIQQGTGASFKF